jgi:hypothetical protein
VLKFIGRLVDDNIWVIFMWVILDGCYRVRVPLVSALSHLKPREAKQMDHLPVCALSAAMSSSLRNDMTATLRARKYGSTTCIMPSRSSSDT